MPSAIAASANATDISALAGATNASATGTASASSSPPNPSATTFDGQLRRASQATARTTVSLDEMVQTSPTAVVRSTVGLGAMTDVVSTSPITRSTWTGKVGATVNATSSSAQIAAVTGFALQQQGKPYVFATSGPDTFDCSGLVTAAYRKVGVEMPAYTFTQATYGRAVDPSTEAIKPGDLIFVRGGRPAKDLGHVGIALSATEWIQAPHTGDVVRVGPLPLDRVQVVRRIIGG